MPAAHLRIGREAAPSDSPTLLAASTEVHEDASTTLPSTTSSLEVYLRPRPPFLHPTRCSCNPAGSQYLYTTWNRRTSSLSASAGLRFPSAIPCNSCTVFATYPCLHAALTLITEGCRVKEPFAVCEPLAARAVRTCIPSPVVRPNTSLHVPVSSTQCLLRRLDHSSAHATLDDDLRCSYGSPLVTIPRTYSPKG